MAYRVASLSGAEAFGLRDRSQIAPGRRADIVAVRSLAKCDVAAVWAGGVELGGGAARPARGIGRGSVIAPAIRPGMFRLEGDGAAVPVIGINEGQILTDYRTTRVDTTAGDLAPDPARDLARGGGDRTPRQGWRACLRPSCRASASGVGLSRRPFATTITNLIAVGVDYDDMARAATRLTEIEGGFCVVADGKVQAELALPFAGLMSERPFEEVRAALEELRRGRAGAGDRSERTVPAVGLHRAAGDPAS